MQWTTTVLNIRHSKGFHVKFRGCNWCNPTMNNKHFLVKKNGTTIADSDWKRMLVDVILSEAFRSFIKKHIYFREENHPKQVFSSQPCLAMLCCWKFSPCHPWWHSKAFPNHRCFFFLSIDISRAQGWQFPHLIGFNGPFFRGPS